jgi:hypothetical protein
LTKKRSSKKSRETVYFNLVIHTDPWLLEYPLNSNAALFLASSIIVKKFARAGRTFNYTVGGAGSSRSAGEETVGVSGSPHNASQSSCDVISMGSGGNNDSDEMEMLNQDTNSSNSSSSGAEEGTVQHA